MGMNVKIYYCPQPDEKPENSAAFEYAKRASELLTNNNTSMSIDVHNFSADSLNHIFELDGKDARTSTPCIENANQMTCTIVLLSCSADGSVHRIVRKIRNFKNNLKSSDYSVEHFNEGSSPESSFSSTTKPKACKMAIALLGHARCENSANQMNDTIFSHGRKFHQSIDGFAARTGCTHMLKKLEVQVELEGPDQPGGFDEWVNEIANSCIIQA